MAREQNRWYALALMRMVAIAAVGLVGVVGARGQGAALEPTGRTALLVDLDGAVGPASVRHITSAIRDAQADRSIELIILRMNTPGGLVTSMREMIAAIIGSRVPVVGYVAPSGARAASAGTYILYATNIAAMAPGTNVGAATPISLGGAPGLPGGEPDKKDQGGKGSDEETARTKALNDAVAFIRSLAELRGRNVKWAEQAVRKAVSISANEALKLGVIDIIADDVDNLLAAVDGFKVKIGKTEHTLSTKGLTVKHIEPDTLTEILSIITDPNVALILMMIGIYGLIFEFFAAPGSYGPGIVGAICLVLGLYALNQLPFNYAGLALLLIGIACMIAEPFTPTFGVLGFGGIIAFVLGAAFLFDTDVPGFRLSWTVIGSMAVASGLMLTVLLGYVWRALRRPVAGGELGLVGRTAHVLDWDGTEGHVFVHGERWAARSHEPFNEGQSVKVHRLDGLTLVVSPRASDKPVDKPPDRGA